jgi:hypothetical protein
MIHDAENRFSDAQDISGAGPDASTDVVDLGIARDIGTGENLYLVVSVDTTFVGGGITVAVTIETDNDEAFGSPTSPAQTIGTFAALSVAGSRFVVRLQPDAINERFMRVLYTQSGALTTGAVTAFIVHGIDAVTQYGIGYTVTT